MRRTFIPLLLVAMVTVACAPSRAPEAPTAATVATSTTTTRPLPAAEVAASFRRCMAQAGVELPPALVTADGRIVLSPWAGPLERAGDQAVSALETCSAPLLQAGMLDLSGAPELRTAVVAALGKLAACIREHGVTNFPDPAPGYDGTGVPFPQAPTGPAVAAAARACVISLFPAGG